MKTIFALVVTVLAAIAFLRSDMSPWQLVSRADLDDLNRQIEELKHQSVVVSAAATPHTSAWMWDPNYRTALEKTTVAGAPETSKSREHGH